MGKKSFFERVRKNSRSLIVVAAVIFIFVTWSGSTVLEILRLNQLKADLKDQIAEKQEMNTQLDEEIAEIGSQAYIERIARKYLGLYYPNEQIIIPVENVAQAEEATDKEEKAEADGDEAEEAADPSEAIDAAPSEEATDDGGADAAQEDEVIQDTAMASDAPQVEEIQTEAPEPEEGN